MGDFPHYFDIILFAMVAAFLVLRLRSVLGRRTGNERRRDPFLRRRATARSGAADKVVPLGNPRVAAPPPPASEPPADAVAAGLERIHSADPELRPGAFSRRRARRLRDDRRAPLPPAIRQSCGRC